MNYLKIQRERLAGNPEFDRLPLFPLIPKSKSPIQDLGLIEIELCRRITKEIEEECANLGHDYSIPDNNVMLCCRCGKPNFKEIPLQRPLSTEHFVGRQEEILQLIKELRPESRIGLCGPQGIGKSALATRLLWELAPGDEPPLHFPDGIIFYSFRHQPQSHFFYEHIARSFHQDIRQETSYEAALRVLSKRHALLVLDEAEEADNLISIVANCGKCGVLIISRHNIGQSYELRPLSLENSVTLLQAWAGKRATNRQIVEEICHLTGGLPLAIVRIGHYLIQCQENASDYLAWLKEEPLEAQKIWQKR